MERARIIIGHGMGGTIVLATDSNWVAQDINDISGHVDDLGIWDGKDYDRPVGVYLWEGTLHAKDSGSPSGDGYYVDYDGATRAVEPHELAAMLAMKPPRVEADDDDRETVAEGDAHYYRGPGVDR